MDNGVVQVEHQRFYQYLSTVEMALYLDSIVPLPVHPAAGIGGSHSFSTDAKDGTILAPATRVGFAAALFPLRRIRGTDPPSTLRFAPRELRMRNKAAAARGKTARDRMQILFCPKAVVKQVRGSGGTWSAFGVVITMASSERMVHRSEPHGYQGIDREVSAPVGTSEWKMRKSSVSLG